jgi:hypothetical protein
MHNTVTNYILKRQLSKLLTTKNIKNENNRFKPIAKSQKKYCFCKLHNNKKNTME